MTPFELTEYLFGELGLTVIYAMNDAHSVTFTAHEVTAIGEAGKYYLRRGAGSSGDDVTDPKLAEPYLSGFVKWDGCSELTFGGGDGLHLCGKNHIKKLGEAVTTIYERCGALMHEQGANLLEGEFDATKK